jgi:ATP-dependent helicase/DNAse subunit B
MISIIKGKFKSGKTSSILSRVSREIEEGRAPLVLVPTRMEQDELTRKLAISLPSQRGFAGKVFFTLSEILDFIILKSGVKAARLNNFEAFILIKLIIEENKADFIYFQNMDSYPSVIRLIHSILMELRASVWKRGNSFAPELDQAKWKDLFLIYQKYEEKLLEKGLYDSPGLFQKGVEIFEKNDVLDYSLLAIDGFFDFSESQFEFVKAIIHCFEKRGLPAIVSLLDSDSPVALSTWKNFESHFELSVETLDEPPDTHADTSTICAFGKYREAERIANEIERLRIEKAYSYSDIGVIVRNWEGYSSALESVFKRFSIPYYSSKDKPLKENPAVLFLYTILECALQKKSIDNIEILGIAGSNFVTNPEVHKLLEIPAIFSSYIRAGQKGWKKEIESRRAFYEMLCAQNIVEEEDGFSVEEIRRKLKVLNRIEGPLVQFLELVFSLEENFTLDSFLLYFSRILHELGLKDSLNVDDGFLSAKDFTAFRKLNESLLSLKKALMVFGKKNFTKEDFFSLFDGLIRDINYRYSYYPADGVKILSPFDARGSAFKAVFIVGLNEGEFPAAPGLSVLDYSEKRRLNLLANRLILQDEEKQNNLERLDFAVALSRAEEKVYLCRTPFDESGRQLLPSLFFLSALKKACLPENNEEELKMFSIVPSESWLSLFDLPLLLQSDLDKLDLETKKRLSKKFDFIPSRDRMVEYFSALSKADDNPGRLFFGDLGWNEESLICSENRRFVQEKMNKMVFSSSSLEKFGNCRHQFFFRYILNITEESYPRQEIESVFKGLFYHAVLKEYVEKTKDEHGEVILGDRERFLKILSESLEKTFLDFLYKEGEQSLFRIEKKHFENVLKNFIQFEAGGLRNDADPKELELSVQGEIKLGENRAFKVTGVIDRVDQFRELDKDFFRIIDYKSGAVERLKKDFKIPLKLFQGFIYARLYGKPIREIVYVSIEKNGKNKKVEILPFSARYNRKTKDCDVKIQNLEDIWFQKEKELCALFGLIEQGNFSPFSMEKDFSSDVLDFYRLLLPEGEELSFEAERKCLTCAYQKSCLRKEKLL